MLELRRGADVENLKNMLYKKTRLEDTFSVNMLAVADGRPETLNLKQIIEHHVDFQIEVCTRKHQILLEKEQEKKEIQEGLIQACDVIDLIIEVLRGSKSKIQAKECLTDGNTQGIRFKTKTAQKQAARMHFTSRQADAILDMRLYRLIGLEVEALIEEHKETLANIARYEEILNNYSVMMDVIVSDLNATKRAYGRKRRTVVENAQEAVFEEKRPEEMEVVFLMDKFGYAKTIDKAAFERNRETVREEYKYVFSCMNTDKICVFTNTGKLHLVKVMELPQGKVKDKGVPIDNVSNYNSQEERAVFVGSLAQVKESSLLFATAQGLVKQVEGREYDVSKRTVAATKLAEEDELIFAGISDHAEYVVLQTGEGYFLRLPVSEVPFQKKNSRGVRGIRLGNGDLAVYSYLLDSTAEYSIDYNGTPVSLSRLRLGKRDTRGSRVKK